MLLRQRRIRQRVRCPPHLLNVYFFVLKCTLNLPFNLTLGSRAGVVVCVGTTPEKPEAGAISYKKIKSRINKNSFT